MSPETSPQTVAIATEKIVPRHLGIILDGNRRWAVENGLPKTDGHKYGWETLRKMAGKVFDRGVAYLSVYVFSTENWNRSKEEVNVLMGLLYSVATKKVDEIHKQNVRVVFLGRQEGLSPRVVKAIQAAEEKTAKNTKGTLIFCLNYGGQQEIADAFKALMAENVKPEAVTPELIGKHVYHPEVPPLDLIIRTSGEQRISNFMLWRAAYAELLFIQKHWPDFNEADLDAALAEYSNRSRRFGK